MKDIGCRVLDVVQANGKSAATITNGLKSVGNGSMQIGILKIAEFYRTAGKIEGIKIGTIRGAIGTTAFLTIFGSIGYFIYSNIENNKKQIIEGSAIINDFEDGIIEYLNENGECIDNIEKIKNPEDDLSLKS